ncbi:MAG: hypothetical protein ABIQ18_16380 [Umezawaea sp.]
MKTAYKVSAFALGLAMAFGVAWAVGDVVRSADGGDPPARAAATGHGDAHPAASALPPGLSVSENGYTLRVASSTPELRFRITGPDTAPVTGFQVQHDKRLHLVLVRRDGSGYQHLHPEMDAGGTWSTPLVLPAAGTYRIFADFLPDGGPKTVLGTDLQVAGAFEPQQYAVDTRTSTVDGYTVRLDGDLRAGAKTTVTATVAKDGKPVTDLQPYLGANGHLVALRSADLAYLHVHPEEAPGSGPEVAFAVEVPTDGKYRLFFDFQHEGVVRTADFTLTASAPTTSAPTTATTGEDGHAGHG